MRIWDVDPGKLCRSHLLGEHRELHALWSVITKGKKAYANHPETNRWRGKLKALYARHESLVEEMERRGYCHKTPLDKNLAKGRGEQDEFVDFPERQAEMIRKKNCGCRV